MSYNVIILASGEGERAKLGYNKVLFKMENGKTVLENACKIFLEDDDCRRVIVVTNEKYVINSPKLIKAPGGKTRSESVWNGLQDVNSANVLIHDAARPFLKKIDLEKIKVALEKNKAAILAIKETDTIKYVKNDEVETTLNRDYIYRAVTPQGFKTELIKRAYKTVLEDCYPITDDASACEYIGESVKVIEGLSSNIKLTNPEDFKNI